MDEHAPQIISLRTQALLAAVPHPERGIFLAMAHGVRPGEARALDRDDAQEREGTPGLLVRRGAKGGSASSPIRGSKNRTAAWIPVGDDLAEWIAWRREQPDSSPALFVNPRAQNAQRRWTGNTLQSAWKLACAAVGVDVGLYEGLKHSSASAWFSGGVPLPVVQRMLRHKDARSTERYAKLSSHALIEAFRRPR